MARPIPVFPAVPSTMVAPGVSRPRDSASSMIPRAARSLTDPPGFMNSAFPRISQPVNSERRRRRKRGVWPMWLATPPYRDEFGSMGSEDLGLSVGLRCVAEIRFYFPHAFGKQFCGVIVGDSGHHNAVLAVFPVGRRSDLSFRGEPE